MDTVNQALITNPVLIFFTVLVILVLAPLIFKKIKVPHIVGIILAGVVVGPYGFHLLDRDSSFQIFGQVGLLYLMFLAGLEIDLYNLLENECRVRLAVFRDGDGLYTPTTNATAYLLEVSRLDKKVNIHNQAGLIVDVFPDHRKPINTLSGLKTSNALLYVLAANYRKKHGLDDVVILNQDGFICESSSSNIFVIYQNTIYTPALTEGCVRGVMRRSIIDFAQETGIEIIEAQISPHILNEAEEIFLTNAVHGMQCVLGYKKKRYFNRLSKVFWGQYEQWLYKPSVD